MYIYITYVITRMKGKIIKIELLYQPCKNIVIYIYR